MSGPGWSHIRMESTPDVDRLPVVNGDPIGSAIALINVAGWQALEVLPESHRFVHRSEKVRNGACCKKGRVRPRRVDDQIGHERATTEPGNFCLGIHSFGATQEPCYLSTHNVTKR